MGAPKLSDAQLESIAQETRRMGTPERVAYWDKRQSAKLDDGTPAPGVAVCPNDRKHGALIINRQGTLLLCGVHKGGAFCTGSLPVSL